MFFRKLERHVITFARQKQCATGANLLNISICYGLRCLRSRRKKSLL